MIEVWSDRGCDRRSGVSGTASDNKQDMPANKKEKSAGRFESGSGKGAETACRSFSYAIQVAIGTARPSYRATRGSGEIEVEELNLIAQLSDHGGRGGNERF